MIHKNNYKNNKNNKNDKNDYTKLSVCSYNLLWELMDYENPKSVRFKNIKKSLLYNYKQNIIHNIKKVIDYLNPFIYCFQETSNYHEILKLFNNNYKYHLNFSDLEYMITVWQCNKLDLLFSFDGSFEKGRPFCILIFYNKIHNYKFMFINIHAGHNIDTYNTIIKPIQDLINSIDIKLLEDIDRIIITGDFNRNINHEINKKNTNIFLSINNIKYNFHYNDDYNNNTCCDIYGNNITKNCDNTIDSLSKPILKYNLNKENWYKYPSSDHAMIISVVSDL